MSSGDAPLVSALQALAAGRSFDDSTAARVFAALMDGHATSAQAAALLMGLRARGETAEEVAGAVRALRLAMVRVETPADRVVIDTCGTGGGTVSTFNVSTAAAFVVVGAGVAVAKHGNRSYTSRCGSADVLEALGLSLITEPGPAARLLERTGMTFLFAPAFHPAMKFVAPVRRELAVPTIMNMVGPLANPAGVRRQVVGVGDATRAPVIAGALARLGAEHALVVHAAVGMDEIAPAGPTAVWEVRDGRVERWTLEPAGYGLGGEPVADLAGGDPPDNAARIRRLLAEPVKDPAGRAAVVLNAGAALYVAGQVGSYDGGVEAAAAALDDGRALAVLERLLAAAPASTSG